jgi:hypothetical protein
MTTTPPPGLDASGPSDSSNSEHLEDLSSDLDVDSSQDVTVEASADASSGQAADELTTDATLTPPPLLPAGPASTKSAGTPPPLSPAGPASTKSASTPPPMSPAGPPGAKSGTPAPLSPGMTPSTPAPRRSPTLLGLPLPSLPLPGVTAAARPTDADEEDVTILARPSVTDDDEEATKVEPAATALRAAASRNDDRDELSTALSAQASVEREKALRKSMPPSLDLPLPAPSARADRLGEFEDPEDEDPQDLAHDTPAAISVDDDAIASSASAYLDLDDGSSDLEAVLTPRRPTGSPPFGSAIGAHGRGEGFANARLPAPSSGYGFSLPSPGPSPAPPSSPFSARLAPVGSPYAGRASAPMPAIQIPAPSGAAAPSSGSAIFYKVQVPVVGLVALLVAAAGGGVLVGAKLWRAGAPAPLMATAPPAAPARTTAPIVVQQPPAPAPAAPTTVPATVPAPPPPPNLAAAPAPAAVAAPAVAPPAEHAATAPASPPRPPKHVAARPPRTTASAAGPAKPAKPPAKVAKGWVDPFAE